MVVFDVDGTLLGGEQTDWACFDAAFLEIAGFALDRGFFNRIEEVTAQAVVHQALAHLSLEERKLKEAAMARRYLELLKEACVADPNSFPAADGAAALLRDLRARNIPVAIATGDWRPSIEFKLKAAGIAFEGIPIATSSDFYSRADIIAGAVAKAGGIVTEAVYVGDGLWDMRACRKLGIPFIGVGHRREMLQAQGAFHHLPSLAPAEFWRMWDKVKSPAGNTAA
jgi:phosphoglycolate phosphatase-like HAD superfamily hydrolase